MKPIIGKENKRQNGEPNHKKGAFGRDSSSSRRQRGGSGQRMGGIHETNGEIKGKPPESTSQVYSHANL